mmetsp:Transcript_38241/g.85376  ORF Transcript_38241/g.85376 Transcript_38241/m.85376 type:complete len:212 (-) Transcript_38241:230-865(-)
MLAPRKRSAAAGPAPGLVFGAMRRYASRAAAPSWSVKKLRIGPLGSPETKGPARGSVIPDSISPRARESQSMGVKKGQRSTSASSVVPTRTFGFRCKRDAMRCAAGGESVWGGTTRRPRISARICFLSRSVLHGDRPVKSSCATTPRAHQSVNRPPTFSLSNSGAMYMRLPVGLRGSWSELIGWASPKSMIFTWPRESSMRFSTLKRRTSR